MATSGRPTWYKPDVGLSMRMVLTMFLLGLVYVVFGFLSSPYGLATLGRASQARVVNVAQRGGMCVLVVGHPPGRIVASEGAHARSTPA